MMSVNPQNERSRSRADVIQLVERGAAMELGRYLRSNPILQADELAVLQKFTSGELNSTTAAKALMALPPRQG